jgi:hypothetical protein
MQAAQFQIIFLAFGVVWVGGWGFLMFRYPEFFAKMNARFGWTAFATPKGILFTRRLGVIEMVLAALAVLNALLVYAFGSKW